MAVVIILASGAVIAIKLYNWAVNNPDVGLPAMESIKRQAAVVGTLAVAVFLLCEALEKIRLVTGGLSSSSVSSSGKWVRDQASAAVAAALGGPLPGGVPG